MTTLQAKKDFPIFRNNPGLVFLDSGASSQKPQMVIDAERKFYEEMNANVHRGVYELSQKATQAYEEARGKVRKFINAASDKEIIFTRNTTESINLVARTFGQTLKQGDVILLTEMEHHSNILPWQQLRDERGIVLRWIPLLDHPFAPLAKTTTPTPPARRGQDELILYGELDLTNLDDLLRDVKLVAVTQMSNVLGTVNDVKTIAAKAHAVGAKVLVDGAQSVPHMPVDVRDLDCDWLVFSGHKMLGPMGIGVLYGKQEILEAMPPFLRGGDMILEVTKNDAKWAELPAKFEAGTPNVAGAVGLGAAVDYLQALGMEKIWAHEQELTKYGLAQLGMIEGLRLLGTTPTPPARRGLDIPHFPLDRGAIFAFDLVGIHPHDIGSILDSQKIAVRSGYHCAQPLHDLYGLNGTTRASCYLYNTQEDIDALVVGLKKVREVFR